MVRIENEFTSSCRKQNSPRDEILEPVRVKIRRSIILMISDFLKNTVNPLITAHQLLIAL